MQNLFANPAQNPAISSQADGQRAVQGATSMTRKTFMPPAGNADNIEYKAYKMAQEARGLPVLPKTSWQMAYRHQLLLNKGS